MSTTDAPGYAPEWLELREGADAAARATGLLEPLQHWLSGRDRDDAGLVIRDLGCGTGSMGRWLAPRLNGTQHWILHDRDPALLDLAAVRTPDTAADGKPVTVTTERGEIARLSARDLAGASLLTASGRPPTVVASTGMPRASASVTAMPYVSAYEVSTMRSAAA